MVGMKDSVTAITFVALGTSLPDTFASRFAAMQDKTADNAIGNVTGSNSVNVFLGLGLPWLMAAIYWSMKGGTFTVPAGSLGFRYTYICISTSTLFLALQSIWSCRCCASLCSYYEETQVYSARVN